ncbi:hypothetical protein NDU88_003213, partial [Pleurodeles waltl]
VEELDRDPPCPWYSLHWPLSCWLFSYVLEHLRVVLRSLELERWFGVLKSCPVVSSTLS